MALLSVRRWWSYHPPPAARSDPLASAVPLLASRLCPSGHRVTGSSCAKRSPVIHASDAAALEAVLMETHEAISRTYMQLC